MRLFLSSILIIFFVGCSTYQAREWTYETVIPGDPPHIVVEYPTGINQEQVELTTIDGHVEAVCPVPYSE